MFAQVLFAAVRTCRVACGHAWCLRPVCALRALSHCVCIRRRRERGWAAQPRTARDDATELSSSHTYSIHTGHPHVPLISHYERPHVSHSYARRRVRVLPRFCSGNAHQAGHPRRVSWRAVICPAATPAHGCTPVSLAFFASPGALGASAPQVAPTASRPGPGQPSAPASQPSHRPAAPQQHHPPWTVAAARRRPHGSR